MDRSLLVRFWNCGDDQIIQFAVQRAHLNRHEREVLHLMLDECKTQEETAEILGYSTRRVQKFWYDGADKLLHIPWVEAYAKTIKD